MSDQLPLADRDQRLAAAITDGLLLLGTTLVCLTAWVELTGFRPQSPIQLQGVLVLCGLPFSIVQWVLICRRGQTVGKWRQQIRIEQLDGAPVGFVRGVLLRTWIFLALALVLAVTRLIDCLFIYRADRRCLHDLVAGTRVVRLTPPA
ncbi:MAG: RDD family protein [Polyangiaceae bacterium]|nr:RDD family protein [Polyangiaceae bacterium]MCW5789882.1 RDD family protein [Polyangiaceae bacterium]